MANPKRRISKSRRLQRRSHWKLASVNLSTCSNCNELTLPHRVCVSCGFYNGKQVIKIEEEKKKS